MSLEILQDRNKKENSRAYTEKLIFAKILNEKRLIKRQQ